MKNEVEVLMIVAMAEEIYSSVKSQYGESSLLAEALVLVIERIAEQLSMREMEIVKATLYSIFARKETIN